MKTVLAASHLHSDWSYDAKWPLPRVAAAFARFGYRVLLTTEHDDGFSEDRRLAHRGACAAASTARTLVVPGMEYSNEDNSVHVLVWGDVPYFGAHRATEDLLEHVTRHSGIAVLAHPWRKEAWKRVRPSWGGHLLGVEVWNRKYDGVSVREASRRIADEFGALRFAGHDFHLARQMFPIGLSLGVEGGLDERSVLDAIRARRCAATAMGLDLSHYSRAPLRQVSGAAERVRKGLAALIRRGGGRR